MGNQYKRDYNQITLKENCAIIHTIYKKEPKEIIIDLEDVENLKKYTWSLTPDGYARTKINKKHFLMHRIIMKCPSNKVIDHINRNRLDNRKSNLRICTILENCHNKNIPTNNKSGFAGVIFNKKSKKWKAYIMCNGINYHLGFYLDKKEAIQARKKAELKYNFL